MPDTDTGKAAMRTMVRVSYLLQVPLFVGLLLALVLFAATFLWSIVDAVRSPDVLSRTQAILLVLDLLDMIFIANLITMVMVSGYNTYYAPGMRAAADAEGFTERDGFGAMKPRIAGTIVLISAIHLLHEFLDKPSADWRTLSALIAIHLTLLATAVAITLLGRGKS